MIALVAFLGGGASASAAAAFIPSYNPYRFKRNMPPSITKAAKKA
jgi:hypothetical protein